MPDKQVAVFGTGCFWCSEALFSRLRGVISIQPGYAGGHTDNPTYEQVSTSTTGNAEVVRVGFNPSVISYEELLEVFWHMHDPTSLNPQGNDVGTQYRSIILYASPEQKQKAEKSLAQISQSGEFEQPIVTEIKELKKFYPAENYHQNYYANNSNQPYCRLVIDPKIRKLMDHYSPLLKT